MTSILRVLCFFLLLVVNVGEVLELSVILSKALSILARGDSFISCPSITVTSPSLNF